MPRPHACSGANNICVLWSFLQVANNVRSSTKDTADKTRDTTSKAQDKVTGEPLDRLLGFPGRKTQCGGVP